LQGRHGVARAFPRGRQQVLGEALPVGRGILEGRGARHARVIAPLALHRLAAAHLDAHGLGGAVFGQPRLDIVLRLLEQVSARRLADLLAQVGTGNEHLGDDLGETVLRRLGGVAALRRVIPDLIEVGADILDRLDSFEQRNQPDRGDFGRWVVAPRLLELGAHLPVERDQRLGPGRQADLQRQGHAGIAIASGDGVDFVHVVDGRVDRERVPRGD